MTVASHPGQDRHALDIGAAITHVSAGGLLGFPTETSWGLAADARASAALARLRAFKGRDAAQAVSVLVSGPRALELAGAKLPSAAEALLERFWPGPLTIVLRCDASAFAPGIANAAGGVGFRCSPHPVASALAHEAERRGVGPLTATSLNFTGNAACEDRSAAEALLAEAAGSETAANAVGGLALVAGADAGGHAASTVVDASVRPLRILREGAIALADLHRTVPGELAA